MGFCSAHTDTLWNIPLFGRSFTSILKLVLVYTRTFSILLHISKEFYMDTLSMEIILELLSL